MLTPLTPLVPITDEDRETLKLAWSVIDTVLKDVPGFGDRLPLGDWWRISQVLGRLAVGPEAPLPGHDPDAPEPEPEQVN